MDLSLIFDKCNSFVEKSIGDEMVLVPLSNNVADMNKVYTLNEVGAFLYNNIDGHKNIKELTSELIEKYDVTDEVALKDINSFINDMVNKGVLFEKQ